jgi:hypothetical protein
MKKAKPQGEGRVKEKENWRRMKWGSEALNACAPQTREGGASKSFDIGNARFGKVEVELSKGMEN